MAEPEVVNLSKNTPAPESSGHRTAEPLQDLTNAGQASQRLPDARQEQPSTHDPVSLLTRKTSLSAARKTPRFSNQPGDYPPADMLTKREPRRVEAGPPDLSQMPDAELITNHGLGEWIGRHKKAAGVVGSILAIAGITGGVLKATGGNEKAHQTPVVAESQQPTSPAAQPASTTPESSSPTSTAVSTPATAETGPYIGETDKFTPEQDVEPKILVASENTPNFVPLERDTAIALTATTPKALFDQIDHDFTPLETSIDMNVENSALVALVGRQAAALRSSQAAAGLVAVLDSLADRRFHSEPQFQLQVTRTYMSTSSIDGNTASITSRETTYDSGLSTTDNRTITYVLHATTAAEAGVGSGDQTVWVIDTIN